MSSEVIIDTERGGRGGLALGLPREEGLASGQEPSLPELPGAPALIPQLLDRYRLRHGLESDAALARALSVSRQVVRKWRSGEKGVPARRLQELLAGSGAAALSCEEVAALLSRDMRGVILQHQRASRSSSADTTAVLRGQAKAAEAARPVRAFGGKASSRSGTAFVCRLLDRWRHDRGLPTDIALADELGVSVSLVSHWRRGKTPVSANALRVLLTEVPDLEVREEDMLELVREDVREVLASHLAGLRGALDSPSVAAVHKRLIEERAVASGAVKAQELSQHARSLASAHKQLRQAHKLLLEGQRRNRELAAQVSALLVEVSRALRGGAGADEPEEDAEPGQVRTPESEPRDAPPESEPTRR
jgi:transcriptional regulator with XRE-family HTH domain